MTAISWKTPVNGNWSVAANWSTGAVPTLADDVSISAVGPYIVVISSVDVANSLAFTAPQAALQESAGELIVPGALIVNDGFVSLNEANSIGSVSLGAGVLAIGNGGALGTGTVTVSGGELLGTATETVGNALNLSGTSTIAAAHGTTLNETSALTFNSDSVLNFGAVGQDGVIILNPGGLQFGAFFTLNVVAGTLKIGSSFPTDIGTSGDEPTTVDAGAIFDLGGNSVDLTNLLGGGAVTDSGAAADLDLFAANFSGVIGGPLSLTLNGAVTLSGANSYTGQTLIGASLQIGVGGATGSIGAGALVDAGTLTIDRNNALVLTNAISGDGVLKQIGTGVTSINTANTYSGGTTITAGTLAMGNAAALVTGTVSMNGGELLATANETLTNALSLSGSSTFAAAHGTTLTETGFTNIGANSTLNFGALGQDGVVLWTPTGAAISTPVTVNVVAGTLKAGSSIFARTISAGAQPTTVAAGATLDLGGFGLSLTDLLGGGAVIDSGAPATLTLGAANFSGPISGALSLVFHGATALSGVENYTGGATLSTSATVANAGVYDIVGDTNISGNPVSSFINNGLFEKTGGGVSDVTSNFVNNGALNVLSGSVKFSGGFTNNSVIHGRVTQSGGVTTVSALVPSDFNEDGMSDILWQNANGQAAIWETHGSTPFGGGPVIPNPGPSWTAVGTGDFDGDGHADILFQNASSGQVSISEMNGNTVIGGGPVSPNPGPAWQAIGSGDFNGDGLSDILFQNTMSGQVSIWEMNGNSLIGGGPVSPNPGLAWKAVGRGDFNGDGFSDILFQNTSTGQVSIWEMKGNTLIGGGPVSPDPGPAWKAIGTGDFNDDGRSDILFQNTTSGQVSIWEMNGNTLTGGGPVSPNPGLSWRAVGTGDFNGDGHSDILFQNTSGQASIWEMNGNTLMGGGPVSANPGASWRAVA
jgi:autotransporter-associated beta strand protein